MAQRVQSPLTILIAKLDTIYYMWGAGNISDEDYVQLVFEELRLYFNLVPYGAGFKLGDVTVKELFN